MIANEEQVHSNQLGVLRKTETGHAFEESTAEQKKAGIEKLRHLVEVLEANCKVEPCEALAAMEPEKRETIIKCYWSSTGQKQCCWLPCREECSGPMTSRRQGSPEASMVCRGCGPSLSSRRVPSPAWLPSRHFLMPVPSCSDTGIPSPSQTPRLSGRPE